MALLSPGAAMRHDSPTPGRARRNTRTDAPGRLGSGSVDLDAVATWMSAQGLGEGPLNDVAPIPGGTQNVMRRFTRSGRAYVLRRGPAHLRPRSNTSILRETRVLGALADTDVPHPRLIAVCDDPAVLGERSEEHTSELQSRGHLVCSLLLEKKKKKTH